MIEDLGALVDRAAFDLERWQDVVDALARDLPGTRVALQVVDPALGRAAPAVAAGWDARDLDAYAKHYGAINPWVPALLRARPMTTLFSDRVLAPSEFRRSAFYQDWLRHVGDADASTGVKLLDGGGRFGALTLSYDARRADRVNPDATRVLVALAPRIERALRASRIHAITRWRAGTIPLLGAVSEPILVAARDGRLLEVNAAASELVSAGVLRAGASDRIRLADPRLDRIFHAGLRAACAGNPLSQPAGGLRIDTPLGRFALTILGLRPEVSRTLGVTSWLTAGEAALVVMQPCGGPPEVARHLVQRYGLSPAELRVALAMDGARPLPAVAADLGIGYETARFHLKRIFAKLGISRQAELVVLLTKLRGADGEAGWP